MGTIFLVLFSIIEIILLLSKLLEMFLLLSITITVASTDHSPHCPFFFFLIPMSTQPVTHFKLISHVHDDKCVHESIFLSRVHVFSLLNWSKEFSSFSLSTITIIFFLIWVFLSYIYFLAYKSEFCPQKKKKKLPLFIKISLSNIHHQNFHLKLQLQRYGNIIYNKS